MSVDQAEFTAAMLDPERAVPAGLTDPAGRPAGRRFAVYRNNVAVSLTDALETAFPVIVKLVGRDFFQAMAGVYLRAYPPASPLMMHYGQDMPDFLQGFEPDTHLPYLPDVARLELEMRQSYHAADARPADPSVLQRMSPDALLAARFTFVPSMRLVRSAWPIHAIWVQNMQGGSAPEMRAESILITRPDFDPAPHLITDAQAAFIDALIDGQNLAFALEKAGEAFDLAATLGLLLSGQVIQEILIEVHP